MSHTKSHNLTLVINWPPRSFIINIIMYDFNIVYLGKIDIF